MLKFSTGEENIIDYITQSQGNSSGSEYLRFQMQTTSDHNEELSKALESSNNSVEEDEEDSDEEDDDDNQEDNDNQYINQQNVNNQVIVNNQQTLSINQIPWIETKVAFTKNCNPKPKIEIPITKGDNNNNNKAKTEVPVSKTEAFAREHVWTTGDLAEPEDSEFVKETPSFELDQSQSNTNITTDNAIPSNSTPEGDLILSEPDDKIEYKVPGSVNAKLRPYQREGVQWLYTHWKQGKGCIIGDDMGLGKTIQAVSFILAILGPSKKRSPDNSTAPVLICAPASVIDNWKREFQRWGNLGNREIAMCSYLGSGRKKHKGDILNGRVEVILTSYDTFRADFTFMNSILWNCAIFDEVHKIKDRKAKVTKCAGKLNTMKRFGLTGTVMQNTFEELWTLLDFVQPGSVGSLKEFSEKYVKPIKSGQKREARQEEFGKAKLATSRINRAVKQIVLRRDQSIIKDLLPGKDDHIVFCTLTPLQLEIYKNVLGSPKYRALIMQHEQCDCKSGKKYGNCCGVSSSSYDWKKLLLPSITTLQKIAQHPVLLHTPKDKKFSEPDMYERAKEIRDYGYGNKRELIKQLIAQGADELLSGKMRTLIELLKIWYQKGNKVLLFSTSTKMLNILQNMLERYNYPFSRLDGSVEVSIRQPIIDLFNSTSHEKKFVFLISTRAGGLGLNITSANVVVVYDASWNVTQDKQAQDRAYRIGQTRHTDVYRFVSAGTVEEMIYQRQIYKQQMANIGLEGSQERRYFNGVLGVKGEEGEIFGLLNLLKLTTERVQSREIIERVHQEEELFKIEHSELPKPAPTPMNKVFDRSHDFNPAANQIIDLDNLQSEIQIETEMKDPAIAEALKSTGVIYAHNNMSVVGDNEVEKLRAKEATDFVLSKGVHLIGEYNDDPNSTQLTTTINVNLDDNDTTNLRKDSDLFTTSFLVNSISPFVEKKRPPSQSYDDILNRVQVPSIYDTPIYTQLSSYKSLPKQPNYLLDKRQLELEKQRQLQRERKKRKLSNENTPTTTDTPSVMNDDNNPVIPDPPLKRKLDTIHEDEIALVSEKSTVNNMDLQLELEKQRQLQRQRKLQKLQTTGTPVPQHLLQTPNFPLFSPTIFSSTVSLHPPTPLQHTAVDID